MSQIDLLDRVERQTLRWLAAQWLAAQLAPGKRLWAEDVEQFLTTIGAEGQYPRVSAILQSVGAVRLFDWIRTEWLIQSRVVPLVRELDAAEAGAAPGTQTGEGEIQDNNRSKGIPREEAEIRVRDWLARNAKENPSGVTRDAIAAGTKLSAGAVSNTSAWKAFRACRDAHTKPGPREVPLTEVMQAVVPDNCTRPEELAALIEEQRKDEAEQERRHKRRHRPS